MDQSTKIRKGVEINPIAVDVEARAYACGKKPTEKGVIRTGKKVYRNPIPSTNKETELPENINDDIEWVFRAYGRPLKKSKDPLPPREDVMEFYV